MTRLTVLCNRLAVLGLVVVIVATEATLERHVTKIVGISAPANLHRREDVLRIERLHAAHGVRQRRG